MHTQMDWTGRQTITHTDRQKGLALSFCFSFCPVAELHLSTTALDEEEGEWAQLSRGLACDAGLFFTDCHGDAGDLHSRLLTQYKVT